MAVIIAKKVAFDLSKAFKMLVTSDNFQLCIYYPFSDSEGTCWEERLPITEGVDAEALLSYLVQVKESNVILVWDDLLKNFRKQEEEELKEEIRKLKEELLRRKSAEAEAGAETEEEKEDIQSLKEEIQKLRDENERLRKDYCALMSELNALRRELEEHEEDN